MLNLIFGPSGSGKTNALTDAIRQDVTRGIRCFLLVPEQQAYISERDIPSKLPADVRRSFEVVNFSSLADAVFRKHGGVTQGTLTGGMKSLVMWDTLRELSPLLLQYGKSAKKDTTLNTLMLQAVTELQNNGITSDALEDVVKALPADSSLRKKLSDLALINAVFHERIESIFGSDPSDRLIRMAQILKQHDDFQNCHVYVDSFTSFTAQEYAVLYEIFKQSPKITVTLCTDALNSNLPHFENVTNTAKKLRKLAAAADIPVQTLALSSDVSQKPKALSILEQNLWKFDAPRNTEEISDTDDTVRLVSCTNLYEEAEAAALHILELVQSGMLYGEIAIVVRDTEAYRGILDAALERYKIPYFLSEAKDLASMPLSRLVLSALRAIDRHYQAQDIMTLLKTGLTGADFEEAAMFEEYCETWHITGSRFTDSVWSMNPDGLTTERSERAEEILAAANRVRKLVIEPLEQLSFELRQSQKLSDRCRALYHYLCRLKISEQLSARAKAELLSGNRREAGDTVRLYRFLTETLTELCTAFPNAEVTTEEMISAFTILFSQSDLASVPNIHDCVMIGSADTLRVENIRASLILGLCEGEFPRALSDDGVLSEGDKETLERFGVSLDSRADIRSSEELFYVYRAITKPTEKLYLSTVSVQIDGSAKTPSLAFSRACMLLDRKAEHFDLSSIKKELDALSFTQQLPVFTAPASKGGSTLRLSQSKIRTFMLCPFSYYSTYHLKLREKKDSKPSYADDGLFLHYVFEHFLRAALQEDGRLMLPAREEIPAIAYQIVEDYLMQVCPLPPDRMDSRLLHIFARLRKLALIMLSDILDELSMSLFVPSKFEQVIGGYGEDGLPPVILDLQNGSRVILSGKIDRVDMYRENDRVYIRVVDYKSGTHKFSLEDVRSGMDIQLVLYLFAVTAENPKQYVPSGAQYLYAANDKGSVGINRSGFLLSDEAVTSAADRSESKRYTHKLLSQTNEEIQELIKEMNLAVCSAAERILAGEAQKTPSQDACMFCAVRAHCDKAYQG